MTWRQYFGIDPALDAEQPGHSLGCFVFYGVFAACLVALIYAMLRGQ